MTLPCRASCINQKGNQCQLQDERIKQSQVEFGDEWNPVTSCIGYIPRGDKEAIKRRKK